ncbi:MAG: polysaccharide biosynthesis tyrosine autokinase, partial [Deltaproteobacteria bacterium]
EMKPQPETYAQPDLFHISDLFQVFKKRMWAFFGSFALVVLSTAYFTWKQIPIYVATTSIYVGRNSDQALLPDYRPTYASYLTNERNIQTQIHILKSVPVLSRVVKQLGLADPETDPYRFEAIVHRLRRRVSISRIEDTDLLQISVSSSDPTEARDIANTLARVYQQRNIEKSIEYSRNAISWLTEQIADLKDKLEKSEQRLLDYQSQEKPLLLSSMEAGHVNELKEDYVRVQAKIIETQTLIESLLRLLEEGEYTLSIPVFFESDILRELNAKIVDAELRLQELSQRYLPKHPKIEKQQKEILSLKAKLLDEVKKILKGLQIKHEILRTRLDNLADAIARQDQEIIQNNRKQIQYSILQRDADTNKELYNVLVRKLKEVDISAEISENVIDIVEEAEVPRSPVYPKKTMNLLISMGAGIFLGIGLVFLLEYMDRTIKSGDEASAYLGLPVLATIPQIKELTRHGRSPLVGLEEDTPTSKVSEAFRTLRTNIKFSTINRETKNFLVTSTNPKEGKSIVTVNLGISFARTEKRTLLVDTDLRKPILHRYLGLPGNRGITNYLVGEVDDIETVIQPTGIGNLHLLASGPKPPNPAELLESERMRTLISLLKSKFDFVIYDSSPVGSVVDASILGTQLDAVLFIVYAGKTDKNHVRQAIGQLQKVQARICGLVVNGLDLKSAGYKYYYYYGYGREDEAPTEVTAMAPGKTQKG